MAQIHSNKGKKKFKCLSRTAPLYTQKFGSNHKSNVRDMFCARYTFFIRIHFIRNLQVERPYMYNLVPLKTSSQGTFQFRILL